LEPAANWSDDFKRRLQATYPFLNLENGLPLPAIYFTDARFRNLKIREPRFTIAGFRKAINQSREAMADSKNRIRHLVNQQYLRKETPPCKKVKTSPSMLPTAEEMPKTVCIPIALRLQMKHLLWRHSLGTLSALNTGTTTAA
jgi:hypothetical protein